MAGADDLLADLDGLSDDGDAEQDKEPNAMGPPASSNSLKRKAEPTSDEDMSDLDDLDNEPGEEGNQEVGGLVLSGGVKPSEELDVEDVQKMELGAVQDVGRIATLDGSKRMSDILKVGTTTSVFFTHLNFYSTGNREIPDATNFCSGYGAARAYESRVQSYRASKQSLGGRGQ
jgi:hypothetical protein